jgi:hypothetical protein
LDINGGTNDMSTKTQKYRVESGSLYEYSEDHKAYLFCTKLNGRTKAQAIRDIEYYETTERED